MHSPRSSSAFTLVELMIVIAIIGMMIVFISQVTKDQAPAIDRERATRFANAIQTTLSSAYSSTYLGKGVFSGANLVFPERYRLILKDSGTILSEYRTLSGDLLISSGTVFQFPFFDADKKYQIMSYVVCNSGSTMVNFTGGIIEFSRDTITFTGVANATGSLFEMGIQYGEMKRYILLDRRVGRTEIKNGSGNTCK